jgi:hypothetical protein
MEKTTFWIVHRDADAANAETVTTAQQDTGQVATAHRQ